MPKQNLEDELSDSPINHIIEKKSISLRGCLVESYLLGLYKPHQRLNILLGEDGENNPTPLENYHFYLTSSESKTQVVNSPSPLVDFS